MKINQIPTSTLRSKRDSLLKSWPTEYTVNDERKKVVKVPGKGDESPSLYFRHISEELHRRGAS